MTTEEQAGPHGLRQALAADPLGLATHHDWESEEGGTEAPSSRWALLRLALVVVAVVGVAYAAGVGETVLLVFALIVCIVLHELGHFLTAKAAGMKVTEFFVGFGPRLWSVKKGETEYGVKGLPFGGYCRIIGMHNLEEVDPADEPRTYRQKPVWRRLSVATAGSAMHFLIAIVVLFAMFFWTGDNGNYLPLPANNPIVGIESLSTGQSPAEKAGIQAGDRILAIDGHHFATFEQMGTFIQARPDKRLTLTVERSGRVVTLHATTVNLATVRVRGPDASAATHPTKPTGFLGIVISDTVHSSFTQSVSNAGGAWAHVAGLTVGAFGRLVTLHGIHEYLSMLSSKQAADSPTNSVRFESPVGVVRLFHSAAESGLPDVLYLLAVINISLGIFNMIPMLPLDGGHVVIAAYEGVRSRRRRRYHADVAKLLPLFYLTMALIIFLGASSLFLDLRDALT